ncbi:hypothetical protein Taro_053997 [Colocasia esculenta]|uniref:Uncharacterized protein n=1 Tax=Colocasia esculenta TaxID=4460 RepID=A0A843XPV5_COLES|nr:hypothetical protein [Colocasia esculenta]
MGVVSLALCGPVLLVVSIRCSLGSVVPFLGANPWWHQRVWFPDLVVCPRSGVVLLVGLRPRGGLRWPCLSTYLTRLFLQPFRIFGSVGGGATTRDPWRGSGGSGRYSWYQSEESTEICKELITIAVTKKGVRFPCKFHVRAAVDCGCCCVACVVSVVARRVRAVVAQLAVDLLAVFFLVWRKVKGKSR